MTAILRNNPAVYQPLEVVLESWPGVPETAVTILDSRLRPRAGQLSEVQGELDSAVGAKASGRAFTWVDVQAGAEWAACEALIEALELSLPAEGAERIEQVRRVLAYLRMSISFVG
jgi:hypothetical protein